MRQAAVLVAMAAAVLAASGCAGVGGMTTARVLERGDRELTVGPDINSGAPEAAVGMRLGVGARSDVGLRVASLPAGNELTTLGIEASGRRQLRVGERLDIAIGIRGGYRLVHSSGATWEGASVGVPISFGINLRGGRDQLVLAPQIGFQRWVSSGSRPVDLPYAGASIGYSWRVGERLTIFPEISIMRSSTEMAETRSALLLHTGVGFAFAR